MERALIRLRRFFMRHPKKCWGWRSVRGRAADQDVVLFADEDADRTGCR
jgi:hypothetical protein